MADTTKYKNEIEKWFRETHLPVLHPECTIVEGNVDLKWGGKFAYDAVVHDANDNLVAVYCLSCSEYKTSSGNPGAGKYNKIKSDILMMEGTDAPSKTLVFTGKTMYEKVMADQNNGRLPQDFETELISLPEELSTLVQEVSAESVKEVTPNINGSAFDS